MKVWSLTALRKVLAGDADALIDAFSWRDSPQGYNHWSVRANDAVPLSAEDYAFLIRLANEAQAGRSR